jgi:hypothetical protein
MASLRDALTSPYLRSLIRVCKIVRKLRAHYRSGICPSRTVSRCSAGSRMLVNVAVVAESEVLVALPGC